jgi:hypothetical protein
LNTLFIKSELFQELGTLQISVGQGHILHGFKCLGHTMSRVHLPENLHVVEYSRTVVVNTMDCGLLLLFSGLGVGGLSWFFSG